jgi:hypothetical protein
MDYQKRCADWHIEDPVEICAVRCSAIYDELVSPWLPDVMSLPSQNDPRGGHNWPSFLRAAECISANVMTVVGPHVWVPAQFIYRKRESKNDYPRPWNLYGKSAWANFHEYVRQKSIAKHAIENKRNIDDLDRKSPLQLITFETTRLIEFAGRKQGIQKRVYGKFTMISDMLRDGSLLEQSVPSAAFGMNGWLASNYPWRHDEALSKMVFRYVGYEWMTREFADDFDFIFAGSVNKK